jgi:type I restriction enzyme S subunit
MYGCMDGLPWLVQDHQLTAPQGWVRGPSTPSGHGHLVNGKVSLVHMNYITPAKFTSLAGGKLRQGDQVYCLRGSLGKHAVFDLECDAAIASSLVILRPVVADCVPYLSLYLDSDIAQQFLRRFDNGTAQPNLSSADLRKFEVPLPPLAE